jgi:hypothetical protein
MLLLSACGEEEAAGGEGGAVNAILKEFAIVVSPTTVSSGQVTLTGTNEGPNDPHEIVVIKTDLSPEALPTADDGSVDEEGEGIEVIGEIEEFDPGTTESATFDLAAGSYALICNIVEIEDGETESHYQKGMRTTLIVT